MNKVSIITPIFKVRNFIERCVCSLFEQTLEDVEYIFVDDASPDDSVDVLRSCIERYPSRKDQVTILTHGQNKGLPAARNPGLALTSIFHLRRMRDICHVLHMRQLLICSKLVF